MNVSEIFNNREVAYSIIGVASIIVILLLKRDRQNLLSVIKNLFASNFIPVYIIILLYIIFAALLLNKIGIWNTSQIKDTGLWVIFVCLPLFYQIVQVDHLTKFFKSLIIDSFRFIVFVEFIMGLHTFNLWIELVLAFLASFFAILIIYSSRQDDENKAVTRLFKRISYLITACMFLAVSNYIYNHFNEYQDWSYLKQLALPVSLTVLYMPVLYLFVMYVRFEDILCIVLKRVIKSPMLRFYAVTKLLIHFITDQEGLKRWRRYAFPSSIMNMSDIDKSILHIKKQQFNERNPPLVDEEQGWSPYEAKDFLRDKSLFTGFYIPGTGNAWFAISAPQLLSNGLLPNSICYTVKGNKTVVNELELCLKVFALSNKGNSHRLLLDCIEALYYKVCQNVLPVAVVNSVLAGKPYETKDSKFNLIIDKENFDSVQHGYQLEFKILHLGPEISGSGAV